MARSRSTARRGAIVLLVAAGCRGPAPEPVAPVPCPMVVGAGRPLVEGRLPGETTVWFLIDTGAGDFTLLDAEVTRALGLPHELVRDPLMPSIHFSARVPFLEVDGMGRRDFQAYVVEGLRERPEFAGLGVPVSGVLGTGWFRGHCLAFDWGAGTFTAEQPRVRLNRHVTIPLRFGVGGDLHASVRVHGKSCEALIDTATPETIVTRAFADLVGIPYDAQKLAVHRETAVGPGAVRDGVMARIELGSAEVRDLPVLVVERSLPNADLIVGTDVLSRFGVILDLADPAYLVLDPIDGAARPGAHAPLPGGVP